MRLWAYPLIRIQKSSKMQNEKNLKVYNEAMDLCEEIYCLEYPKHEQYGLQSQIRRAATSVPLLISEGCGRLTDADFKHFLIQARGSAKEISTALELSKRLKYIPLQTFDKLNQSSEMIAKMLTNLIKKVGGNENVKKTKNH